MRLATSTTETLTDLTTDLVMANNNNDILLSRLCNVYGITGEALDWFRSYLTDRIQRVVIKDAVSVVVCPFQPSSSLIQVLRV